MRSAPKCAAKGRECTESKSLVCNTLGTTSCIWVGSSRTSMPSWKRIEGLCDQRLRDSNGSARRASRVGVTSRSRKSRRGEMTGSSRCNSPSSSVETSGYTVSACTPRGAVSSSARSNSSIHGVVKFLPACLQMGLETPSALQWSRPGRCSIS